MSPSKSEPTAVRGEPLRQRVLDAAEQLLRRGKVGFSMRDLAAEAEVSFATPFNQFGCKAAIMQALSSRRVDEMEARYIAREPAKAVAANRVLLAVDIAAAVMLEEPEINRVVMSWLGATGPAPGPVLARSAALWARAIGAGEGLIAAQRERALNSLPLQLAYCFRGVLSFWTAGELPDIGLAEHARELASTLMVGFTDLPLSRGLRR